MNIKNIPWSVVVCAGIIVLGCIQTSLACITFNLGEGTNVVYGRNFDWSVDLGAVIVNPRHVRKTAFVLPPSTPVRWTSRYGSVTFNQFSREIPVGGMNEEGLVIESLVSLAEYASRDGRHAITEFQWIQYQLDMCRSVKEVIASDKDIRIDHYALSIHYFITDRFGQSAVIEFIGGRMVARTADTLPIRVLANSSYDEDLTMFRRLGPKKNDLGAMSRFSCAAQLSGHFPGRTNVVLYAFNTLDAVAQQDYTKWQIVYDIAPRRIFFRSLRSHGIKTIDLAWFNFSQIRNWSILDINTDGNGETRSLFRPYTPDVNSRLIDDCLAAIKKSGIPMAIQPEHGEFIRTVVEKCQPESTTEK
jgi:penicillin V acylase-like amidase (Ntn superfamily)